MKLVLLIDDDQTIIEIVREIVESLGFQTLEAENGLKALEILEKKTPDLIITDLVMPEMHGIDFLKEIHENRRLRSVPLIVVSGVQNKALQRKALELGAITFIKKPIDLNLLKVNIKSLLRFSDASRDQSVLLEGDLMKSSVEELIVTIERHGYTGTLLLDSLSGNGKIHFVKGMLDNAEFSGMIESKALDEMMNWIEGNYIFEQDVALPESEDEVNIMPESDDNVQPVQETEAIDLTKAVRIVDDVYFVGNRIQDRLLQINSYLRIYDNKINFLVDPGPTIDYEVISGKIGEVIGDISRISIYSLNSQDPDVSSNAIYLKSANSKAVCMTSEDTWRIVSSLGIKKNRLKLIDNSNDGKTKLPTGHEIQFINTPYCYSRGAINLYDRDSRILFSGDLFGCLNAPGDVRLYANSSDWNGIKTYHQMYMPANRALKLAIDKIRNLDPKPIMIAPQHGAIIKEDLIDEILEKLYLLQVGTDLLEIDDSDTNHDVYEEIAKVVFDRAVELTRDPQRMTFIAQANDELNALLDITDNKVRALKGHGKRTLEMLTMTLCRSGLETHTANQIKAIAIQASVSMNVSPPAISVMEGDNEMLEMELEDFLK